MFMSNRINGDFDPQAIEAFRNAYAASVLTPEDQEFDSGAGLPTDVVLNTSPWIQHTGLWRANPGTEKDFVPNQVLVPGADQLEEEDEEALIEEAIDEFLSEVLSEYEDEKAETEDEEYFDPEGEGEGGFSDEEIDELLEQILDDEEEEGEEEPPLEEDLELEDEINEEEIEALLASLEEELGELTDDEEV